MKKIILTPNPYRDKSFKFVLTAQNYLAASGAEIKICLPFDVDKGFDLPRGVSFSSLERELPGADMLVCFGGDGTILHASKAATRVGVPVLGVNIGTMGFIAELESSELPMLRQIAAGEYQIERRKMLDVAVSRDGNILQRETCLNDVVITKGAVARVVRLSVYCDQIQAMEFGGDGVIVATPTGSTAYSLSAGGPIVEPDAGVMLITPICAHDVQSRPIVASDRRVVTVRLERSGKRNAFLSVDGGRALRLGAGDVVQISRSAFETQLVRLKDRSSDINSKTHKGAEYMKTQRQAKIMEIISTRDIETQEQLLQALQDEGFYSTQATISRDIKELRVVKELTSFGTYRYTASAKDGAGTFSARLNTIFRECITSFDYAQNIIIIKTMPGLASAAASAVDAMNMSVVVGTLAGDDTVFLVMRDNNAAAAFCGEIKNLLA